MSNATHSCRGLGLGTLILLTSLTAARAQEKPAAGVRDGAHMFDVAAVKDVDSSLDQLARKHGLPVVIETIDSLPEGATIVQEAEKRHARDGGRSLYILISRKEGKTSDVHIPKAIQGKLAPADLAAIRDSFTEDFRQRRFSEGLKTAAATIEKTLQGKTLAGPDLIVRDQVRLNLAGAKVVLAAAEAKAAELGLKSNIAVVDDGGHLLAFARMDGARPASGYTAQTKATAAATFRAATGPLPGSNAVPAELLNLSLQNAAEASGGKITSLLGGLPIVVDGQVIGAVGVGGGTGEQDAEVAKAGVNALMQQLK